MLQFFHLKKRPLTGMPSGLDPNRPRAPTVLPFGQKNSGTEAQGPYRQAVASLRNISNYADDWLGYNDDPKDLWLPWRGTAHAVPSTLCSTRFIFARQLSFSATRFFSNQ